ncbi:MAG: tripartite tricarboxylate transporter substrate binding protein [Xanthobacteraceae bacterium]
MTKWLTILASLCWLPLATAAQAQTYPSRTITIVVTAAAGGVTDVVARAIAQRLSEKWGQQIVIENKGGGAHVIGASQVAKAAPDGHTLMLAEAGTYVVNPVLYAKDKLPFDIEKDFIPITGLVRIHHSLIASPTFAPKNFAEVLELARKKPGEITYGTAGIGSGPHVNVVRLENEAKIKLNAIHYRGATPAQNDVMGGHTNMMLISVSSALPNFRAGKVKMYGIGSAKRLPKVPDVPTIAEAGNLPGFLAGTWFGLAVTGGTPRSIVDKINKDVRAVMAEPAFKEKFLDRMLYEPMDSSPEEFQKYIHDETQRWAKVIREQKLVIGH